MHPNRCVLAVLSLLITAFALAGPPMRFNYQAKLTTSDGDLIEGNHSVFFSLWRGGNANVADSGTKVFEEVEGITMVAGIANHAVGTGQGQTLGPITRETFQGEGDLYLQVAADIPTNVILPRTRVESVPFAILSADGEVRTPISQPATFPIVIDQPGSYYLTGNITGVAGADGIEITTNGVTLDLGGFELAGVAGSFSGITAGVTSNIVVRNGTVRGWGDEGIGLSNTDYCRIGAITASANGGTGIATGLGAWVDGCVSSANLANGIDTEAASVVTNCISRSNTVTGIIAESGLIAVCTARSNGSDGILGNFASVVSNCQSQSNGSDGIQVGSAGQVEGCISRSNGAHGILGASNGYIVGNVSSEQATGSGIHVTGADNRIENNNSVDNLTGYNIAQFGNFVVRNIASGNTTNWSAIPGSFILVINATAAGGFAGDSGGTGLGSTDPNANFTY